MNLHDTTPNHVGGKALAATSPLEGAAAGGGVVFTGPNNREAVMSTRELARRAQQLSAALTYKRCRRSQHTTCRQIFANVAEYCSACRCQHFAEVLGDELSQLVRDERQSQVEMG